LVPDELVVEWKPGGSGMPLLFARAGGGDSRSTTHFGAAVPVLMDCAMAALMKSVALWMEWS